MLAYRQSCNAAALPRSAATNCCNVCNRASMALRPAAARSRVPVVTCIAADSSSQSPSHRTAQWRESWEKEAVMAVKTELKKHIEHFPEGSHYYFLEARVKFEFNPAADYSYPSPQLLAERAGVLMSLFPGSTDMWRMVTWYAAYTLAVPPEETVRRLVRLSNAAKTPITYIINRMGEVAARAVYDLEVLNGLEDKVAGIASALEECLPGIEQPLALAQLLVSHAPESYLSKNDRRYALPNIRDRLREFVAYCPVVFPSASRIAARGYPPEEDTARPLHIWLSLDVVRNSNCFSYTHFLYESGTVAGTVRGYPDMFASGSATAWKLPSDLSDAGKTFYKYHEARVAELDDK